LLDRIFLDANVLYSAAYSEKSRLARLWTSEEIKLITSFYAMEEVRRNLARDKKEALQRLTHLSLPITMSTFPKPSRSPKGFDLS
jgi:predicted nucleic acid-binding protein